MSILGLAIHILAVIVAANAAAIFRGRLRTRYQELVLIVCGVIVGCFGLWGVMDNLFDYDKTVTELGGSILILVSLVVGFLLGGSFGVEGILDSLGNQFKSRRDAARVAEQKQKEKESRQAKNGRPAGTSSSGSSLLPGKLSRLPVYNYPSPRSGHRYVDGLAIATVLLCANPFTMLASARAGEGGSMTMLYLVALLDFLLVAALASVFGEGTAYAAIPMGVQSGFISLMGYWKVSKVEKYAASMAAYSEQIETASSAEKAHLQELLDKATLSHTFWETTIPKILHQTCVIGGVILILLAINMVAKKRIKVANLLPALLIPLLYYGVMHLTALRL